MERSLALPLDRPRPPVPSFVRERQARPLPPGLLASLAGRVGAPPAAALAAALHLLLARYQDRAGGALAILPATGAAGERAVPRLLDADLDGDPGFAELARRLDGPGHEEASPGPGGLPVLLAPDAGVQAARADLVAACDLVVWAADGALACDHDADLYEDATIGRFLERLATVLRAALEDPEAPVSRLPADAAAPAPAMAAAPGPPPVGSLHGRFAEQAARLGSSPALLAERAGGGAEVVTYRELADRAGRLSAALRARGAGPGDQVAVLLRRSPALVAALLGVLGSGAAYLPLDPRAPADRLRFALADRGVRLVVTGVALADRLPEGQARLLVEELDPAAPPAAPVERTDADPAFAVYADGPSGPVAAPVTHGSAARSALALATPGERWLAAACPASGRHALELWGPLLQGGVCVLRADERPAGDGDLGTLVERHRVQAALLTAGSARGLCAARAGQLAPLRRLVTFADEPVDASVLADLGDCAPGARVLLAYRADGAVACARELEAAGEVRRAVIGPPLPGRAVAVRDRLGAPAPVEMAGEVLVDGARTGDAGRLLADGSLELLRAAVPPWRTAWPGGDLAEAEAVLRAEAAVDDCVVIESPAYGDGAAAYVVPAAGRAPGRGELASLLAGRLPQLRVAGVIQLAALPRDAHGLVDAGRLPPLDPEAAAAEPTPLEASLAELLAEQLGVPAVGMDDDFFSLGGDSLAAARAAARIREGLGVEVGGDIVFRAPTASALAAALAGACRPAAAEQPEAGPAIRPRRVQYLPLSYAQESLWLFEELNPGTPTYHIPYLARLRGRIDAAALERALAEVVRRHEALRTTLEVRGAEPVQAVHAELAASLAVDDVSAEPDPEAAAAAIAREDGARPFDLRRGPLLRARLLRLGPEDHRLLLTLHHLVTDGRSIQLLLRELGVLHAAFREGRPSPLPAPALQYGDVAVWQREALTGERAEPDLRYWEQRLVGAPDGQPLPSARPRPPVQRHRGATLEFTLPAAVVDGLRELSRRCGATLYTTLLTAFHVLLHRRSGRDDLVTGTAVDGRARLELRDVVGPCLNTVALRADLRGDPTFTELLERERVAVAGALAHQELPFELVVRRLAPERDPSRTPLFQIVFVMTAHPPLDQVWDAAVSAVHVPTGTSQVDLCVELVDDGATVSGYWSYVLDVFDTAPMEALLAGYLRLLAHVVEAPETRISALGAGEAPAAPSAECLHRLVERQAALTPEAAAVRWPGGAMTCAELDAVANRLAARLVTAGAGPESVVGVCLERSAALLPALLGVLKAGAAYLPLDPGLPAERARRLLDDAGAALVVAGERQRALVEGGGRVVLGVEPGGGGDEAAAPPRVAVVPGNAAYVMYTSGSTGQPKGVVVEHGGLVNYLGSCVERWPVGGGAPVFSSFGFDMTVTGLFAPLLSGQPVHLVPDDLDLSLLGRTLAAMGPFGFVKLTPPHLALLADQLEPDQARSLAGVLVVGGEALPPATLRRWRELAPATAVVNEYGPTEGTVASVLHVVDGPPPRGPVPIGRPIAGTTARVLDAHLRPVSPGARGEICLGGACVARGYLGRPDLTAERFVPDPLGPPGARMYRTGDAGRVLAGGELEYAGRLDDQLKLSGYRIEPAEIEAALGRHPAVRAAVVTATGAGATRRLCAFVVPADPGAPPPGAELREFLAARLPAYMVPAAFTTLASVPLTANGKVDRAALAAASTPGRPAAPEAAPEAAPGGDGPSALERVLTGVWEDSLDVDGIGLDDDFFGIGGNSLEATLVVGELRRLLDQDLPVVLMFQAPTVRQLALELTARFGEAVAEAAELVLRVRALPAEERQRLLRAARGADDARDA